MRHDWGTNVDTSMTRRTLLRTGGAGLGLALGPFGARLTEARASASSADTLALAQDRRGDLVRLLGSLVAIRSHSGESAERVQEIVRGYLADLPFDVEASSDVPSRLASHAEFMPPNPAGDGPFVNVVGRPRGGHTVPVAIFSHVDTEIPGDGWTTDPYRLTKSGTRLHGLGAADDKGGVAAMLVAATVLHETGAPLPVVMSLHGKGGGSRGSLPVFERMQRAGAAGDGTLDAVLYAHPAETGRGLEDIKHVVQGALDVTLTLRGWRGEPLEIGSPESALYGDGGDALNACWQAIEHLRSRVLGECSVNVGELEAGDRIGAVPDCARARMRILFDVPGTWSGLLASLESELDVFVAALPVAGGSFSASIEPSGLRTNPGAVDWESAHCRVLRSVVADVTGREPAPYRNHYAGDIRFPIRLLGAPAFGVGSVGGNFYGANEWVDEDDLVRLVAVIVDTVRGWAVVA